MRARVMGWIIATTAAVLSGSCGGSRAGVNTPQAEEQAPLCRRDGSRRDRIVTDRGAYRTTRSNLDPNADSSEGPDLSAVEPRPGEFVLVIQCLVTRDGATEECCVLRGVDRFNAPVLAAAKKWRFQPSKCNHVACDAVWDIQIRLFDPHRRGPVPPPPIPPVP